MFGKKKGFSASQSKHTSRKMTSHTIGTHVAKGGTPRHSRGMNASSVGFSSDCKKRRAARGIVDHVTPQTASGENYRAYSRRVSKRGYIQSAQRKSGMRRAAVGVISVIVIIAVAVGVGVTVFFNASNSKLSLEHSNASSALTAAKEGSPYYVLAAANLGSPKGGSNVSSETYILARVDESTRTLTLVSIPGNLAVSLSDGKTHPLYDAYGIGGDEALVKAVSSFAGVGISHLVKTNEEGIRQFFEILEGWGLEGSEVKLEKVLHLKTGVNYLEDGNMLVSGEFIEKPDFAQYNKVIVPEDEAYGANCIWVNGTVIVPEGSDIASVDGLAGKKIGTQRGTTGYIYCSDDFGDDAVVAYDDGLTAVQALNNGQVDAVVIDNAPAKEFVAANPGLVILDTSYAEEDYAIGLAKGSALEDAVNAALEELKADGTLQSIVDKYITAE